MIYFENDSWVFVQYKGTDICMDFQCTCGKGGHFDGYGAYYAKCGECGAVWKLPSHLKLEPLADDDDDFRRYHTPVDPIMDEDDDD